jgi:hypothetical protein
MLTFPTIDPDAADILQFDASLDLPAGEVLTGGPTVTVICTAGTDPSPANILTDVAGYDALSTSILQPVGNLSALVGNDYELEARSACTVPEKIIVIRALLQVRAD